MRNVELTLQLLEEVAVRQPIGVSDLAKSLNIPKTTAHRALKTLHSAGWLEIVDEGRPMWSLSIRALTVGALAVNAKGRLRAAAVPAMEALRRATQETIHLTVFQDFTTVLVERLDGIQPVDFFHPLGGSMTLHPTASGRTLLSHMDDAGLVRYFASEMPATHPLTAEGEQKLRLTLKDIRDQGYATTVGGLFPTINAVAAPIFYRDALPVAAISISASASRLPESEMPRRGELVVATARQVTMGLRMG